MEIADLRVIERTKRDGFRSATAGYLIKAFRYAFPINDNVESNVRIIELANRIGISERKLLGELRKLNDAFGDRVSPGEIYDPQEIRKFKGRIDLQSLLCNALYKESTVHDYEKYLSYITPSNSSRVIYTSDIPITMYNDALTINAQHFGEYYLYYATKISDVRAMYAITKFRLHSGEKTLVIDGVGVESSDKGMITLALNIDMSNNELYNDAVMMLKTATYVTYHHGQAAPFIIERSGIDEGTLIMHVFHETGGTALTQWMSHCETSLKRMLMSILNTLLTTNEAYSGKGLGGQFPIDFYSVLRGTLDQLDPDKNPNPKAAYRISDEVVIDELFNAYINGMTTGVVAKRVAIAFGCLKTRNKPHNLKNLRDFIHSYLTFAMLFEVYDKIMMYNKDIDGVKNIDRQKQVTMLLESFSVMREQLLNKQGELAKVLVDDLPIATNDRVTAIIKRATMIISSVKKYLE
jgi:hypothetical protein